jgi:hypothetical protein
MHSLNMSDTKRDESTTEADAESQRPEPEVVPAISAKQPPIAAGVGVGAYVESDNDQESHVTSADNDGETVPREEVVDHVGG